MRDKLTEDLLKEFPGKMENEQAFIIQYIMKKAQQGEKPPAKEEIEKSIEKNIKTGAFERKGPLLIMKVAKSTSAVPEEEEEEEEELPVLSPSSIKGDFTENQKYILSAFQGKFENRTAIIMNVTMAEMSQGRKPPDKSVLEKSINELIEKGTLETKGDILIKKS